MLDQNKISIAVVLLHPGCNMICNFCVTEEGFDSMTFEQAIELLNYFKQRSIHNIVLGGGEPFTWDEDLIQLTVEAKKRGFFVQIGTNGIDMPENFEFISSIDRYVLPLESLDPAVHNKMRLHRECHHSLILDRLHALKMAGRQVTVSTVVTKQNAACLKNIAEYLKEYNADQKLIHAWHLYKFISLGRGGEVNADKLSVTDEVYNRVCQQVRKMDLDFPVYKRPDMYHSKTVDFFWFEEGKMHHAMSQPDQP